MSFKPTQGLSIIHHATGAGSRFRAIGPLSKGDIVRRITVHVDCLGAVLWRFGCSLGISQSGTQAALRGGRNLLGSSDLGAINGDDGFPHIGFTPVAGMVLRYVFFPGLVVTGGSGWIVTHSYVGAAPSSVICATFEVARWEPSPVSPPQGG